MSILTSITQLFATVALLASCATSEDYQANSNANESQNVNYQQTQSNQFTNNGNGEFVNNAFANDFGNQTTNEETYVHNNGEYLNNATYNEFAQDYQNNNPYGQTMYGNELYDQSQSNSNFGSPVATNPTIETYQADTVIANTNTSEPPEEVTPTFFQMPTVVETSNSLEESFDQPVQVDPIIPSSMVPIVKYAIQRTYKYAGPNGSTVGILEQGDHPVVIEEGEWARLSNGTFVDPAGLSLKSIGRPRLENDWRLEM